MSIKEYANIFGVTTDTVRKWESKGKIKPRRTHGGHRRYTEEDIRAIDMDVKYKASERAARRSIIYCRVSHKENREELNKQVEGLKMFALGRGIGAELIIEIGDGTCMSRPKFRELVTNILNKELASIIVTQESRLLSSGFELLDSIAKSCGCEIIAVDNCGDTTDADLQLCS